MSSVGRKVSKPVEPLEPGSLQGNPQTSVETGSDVRHLPKVVFCRTSRYLSSRVLAQRVAQSYPCQRTAADQN